MGEHPTLIGGLVGMAIANLCFDPLQEMIEQHGCPNLYWALTDLPNPLIDLHKGLQGDRLLVEAEFAGLDEATPMSEAQLSQIVARGEMMKHLLEAKKKEIVGWLEARARDEAHVLVARQRLVEAGLPAERVKAFPALQAVLLDDKRRYEARRDEGMKWMGLPYWQAEVGFLASTAARNAEMTWFEKRLKVLGSQLQDLLLVRKAQARLEQRIALLRHVEALRLYAAEHDGELPKQLGDVKVPLPVDPFTGKRFIYRLEGPTAVIRGSPPKGEEATPAYNLRYEVTIKK
jgi:hypothetical protein